MRSNNFELNNLFPIDMNLRLIKFLSLAWVLCAAASDVQAAGLCDAPDVQDLKCVEVTDASADDTEPNCIALWHKDGSKVVFEFAQKPRLEYAGDLVRIVTGESTVEYDFAAIAKMTYEYFDPVGINTIEDDAEPVFRKNKESLVFNAAGNDAVVKIYSVKGTLLKTFEVKQRSSIHLPLSLLSHGIYLVSVNGVTYKISVQ